MVALLWSCSEDKGNYDYRDINEIVIEGIQETYNVIYKRDTLRISPQLTFSMDDGRADRYQYEWEMQGQTNGVKTIVGTDRDLEYFVESAEGAYTLWFRATDTETDVCWITKAEVNIRTLFGLGMMVIGEDEDGYADIDMVSVAADTVVLRNLMKNNGLPPMRGPKLIRYTGKAYYSEALAVELWITTDDGSFYLDTKTFRGDPTHNIQQKILQGNALPTNMRILWMSRRHGQAGAHMSRVFITDTGDVYGVFNVALGVIYGEALNRMDANSLERYRVFPIIFSTSSFSEKVLYDLDHNRFMRASNSAFPTPGSLFLPFVDAGTEVYPANQPAGRTIIYGENTMNKDNGASVGNSYVLMRETGDRYYVYRFYSVYRAAEPWPMCYRMMWTIDPSVATNLPQARMWAFASQRTFLLYPVGSVLYAYDYNPGNERLYQIDLGSEITCLKFDTNSDASGNTLWVGTYNAYDKGTLTRYGLSLDPNKFELTNKGSWSGLVKIADMDWRDSDL
jgi:hypothetical protein